MPEHTNYRDREQTRLTIKEWLLIVSALLSMMGGIGGTVGSRLLSTTPSPEVQDVQKQIRELSGEVTKLQIENGGLKVRIESLERSVYAQSQWGRR